MKNRLFLLSFENHTGRTSYQWYYLPTVEIKDYNVMIDTQNVFDQKVKNDLTTFDRIQKIKTGQRDDYTTDFLLVYISKIIIRW